MKNKKGKKIPWYLIPLIFLFAIIILVLLLHKPEFNPDTDVCEKTCHDLAIDSYNHHSEEEFHKFNAMCRDENKNQLDEKCLSWRPKTKCELNPEAEGCICDEREPCLSTFESLGQTFCLTHNDSTRFRYIIDGLRNCIKSHEPTECEKGNPNWIWDGNNDTDEINDLYKYYSIVDYGNVTTNMTTIFLDGLDTEGRFCRPKTIQDYSCEELKRFIILYAGVSIPPPELFHLNYYSKKEIYDIAISKGCEI